ncbi:TetR/AcrR family transcriptional regulator [Mycobacterium triplex]|uniref:Tetracycline repressor domain-containing protein n=1 Tax=Mycobacterium triplex TaxID=47839 RepID=A0A024K2Y5_9MYCO|nr:TetR family transcriptional regulator [Mycobacterium triplex]CDO90251.1 tetracycline repressor domain-containing protein [Mycobacterium triplex]
MPRPSKPLIRRDAVVEASLRIIDTEGLDAFSLPRLARELNVQAPSLYHHFEDKAEILKAVARAIVVETRLPDPTSVPNWIEWLVALSLAFRDSMLRHHNAVPLLLQFMPRDVLIRNYNESALYLTEIGVPLEQVVLILEGLDKLTLGAGITEAMHRDEASGRPFANADPVTEPFLVAAVAANQRSATGVFAESIRSFLRGAASQVPESAPPPQHWGDYGSTATDLEESTAS